MWFANTVSIIEPLINSIGHRVCGFFLMINEFEIIYRIFPLRRWLCPHGESREVRANHSDVQW